MLYPTIGGTEATTKLDPGDEMIMLSQITSTETFGYLTVQVIRIRKLAAKGGFKLGEKVFPFISNVSALLASQVPTPPPALPQHDPIESNDCCQKGHPLTFSFFKYQADG